MKNIKLNLEIATIDHVLDICSLVNLAYRGEDGWTKETDIVDGNRTTYAEIKSIILSDNLHLLVAIKSDVLISCICIEKIDTDSFIGLFSVNPRFQGNGVGKHILKLAEEYSFNVLNSRKHVMIVVSQRKELISYYERRGYVRTGKVERYPTDLNVGIPKINNLTIEYLEKNV